MSKKKDLTSDLLKNAPNTPGKNFNLKKIGSVKGC